MVISPDELRSGLDRATIDGIVEFLRQPEYLGAFSQNLLHVQDQKAANTSGGTFTSGARRTRTFNTVVTNEILGASLSSNQITLPAGTYYIDAAAPGFAVDRHKAMLVDITNTVDLIIGRAAFNAGANFIQTDSIIKDRFTLNGTAVVELQHECETTAATRGFGVEGNLGDIEIYADAFIWKIK